MKNIILIVFFLLISRAYADVLIKNCDNPTLANNVVTCTKVVETNPTPAPEPNPEPPPPPSTGDSACVATTNVKCFEATRGRHYGYLKPGQIDVYHFKGKGMHLTIVPSTTGTHAIKQINVSPIPASFDEYIRACGPFDRGEAATYTRSDIQPYTCHTPASTDFYYNVRVSPNDLSNVTEGYVLDISDF